MKVWVTVKVWVTCKLVINKKIDYKGTLEFTLKQDHGNTDLYVNIW